MKTPETTLERLGYDSEVARLAAQVYATTSAFSYGGYVTTTRERAANAVAIARAIIAESRKS